MNIMGRVYQLDTLKDFNDTIKQFDICVVDFTAKWCGPCQKIAPLYEEMSQKAMFKSVGFFKVDIDVNTEASEQQNIECMPTFQIFNKSEKVHEVKGCNITEVSKHLESLVSLR